MADPDFQPELFDPRHVSLHPDRLSRDPERIYAEHWRTRNARHPAVNSGFTALEWILCPTGWWPPRPVSQRDAVVAASVVQWFGTNCGLAFIEDCEREVQQAGAQRSAWSRSGRVDRTLDDQRQAEMIAALMVGHPRHAELVTTIAAALAAARHEAFTPSAPEGTPRGIVLREWVEV